MLDRKPLPQNILRRGRNRKRIRIAAHLGGFLICLGIVTTYSATGLSQPGLPYQETDLRNPLKTNPCHGCNLTAANQSSAKIVGTSVHGANPSSPNLKGMETYEDKINQFASLVVAKLENRYKTPIQFDIPLKIVFLSESDIAYTWCKETNHGNTESKKFNACINDDGVEAYYDISKSSIILRNDLLFDRNYDVGSIVHEVVHYVQDRHGLTWHGRYAMCLPLLEYEAMGLELELMNDLDIRISDWYKIHVNKWKKKFADRLTGKPNCSTDSLLKLASPLHV